MTSPSPVTQPHVHVNRAHDNACDNYNYDKVYPDEVEVLIIGSGPLGSTFLRQILLNSSASKILMVEAGHQESKIPGEHQKNAVLFQRNVDAFVNVIKGHLQTLSVPTSNSAVTTLDPISAHIPEKQATAKGFVRNGQNPDQDPFKNLGGAAATYCVGGMSTHWTCCTPRFHPGLERPTIYDEKTWDRLYTAGERLLKTKQDAYLHSVRNYVVKETLTNHYDGLLPAAYGVQQLPLAVTRRVDNPRYVTWTGSNTILEDIYEAPQLYDNRYKLLSEHLCIKLHKVGGKIDYAIVEDLLTRQKIRVNAKFFIICAGSILTPQILWNSNIREGDLPALGRYLTEQPLSFCQIVLGDNNMRNIQDAKTDNPQINALITEQINAYPKDPIHIPVHDPEPQVWIPCSNGENNAAGKPTAKRPWHCQIHRDAFSYGDVAKNIDTRLIVDLRWFGIMEPRRHNRVTFSDEYCDMMGMPQPTFDYTLTSEDAAQTHAMMTDMTQAAMSLGGFLPGSEPQFMEPGLTLHIQGTCRAGTSREESVVDSNSKVWGFDNLFIGGNSVIPTGTAGNPTLTSMAFAIKSCEHLVTLLKPTATATTNHSTNDSNSSNKNN